jgi:hypothetical protein
LLSLFQDGREWLKRLAMEEESELRGAQYVNQADADSFLPLIINNFL